MSGKTARVASAPNGTGVAGSGGSRHPDRPPDAAQLGERIGDDTLRFARSLSTPVDRVWAALTTPDALAAWLGRATAIELRVGGRFEIAFSTEDRMDGRIVELEPQRRLAIEWHEISSGASSPYGTLPGDRSVISFDLTATPQGGTMLIFTHRYLRGGETLASFGAGWHAHLEALGALLANASPVDREQSYAALKPRYDSIASGAVR